MRLFKGDTTMNKTKKLAIATTIANKVTSYLRDVSLAKFDNGDYSSNGIMAQKLLKMNRVKVNFDADKCDEFEKILTNKIMNEIYGIIDGLYIDYHPDSNITETMNQVFGEDWNSTSVFPWKTIIRYDQTKDKVFIKEGYGADKVEIPLVEV